MSTRLSFVVLAALVAGCGSSESPAADGAASHDGSADAPALVDGATTADGGTTADAGTVTQSFVILHTNDLHSHLMGFGPEADYTPATPNDDGTVGGFARLSARIQRARAEAGTTPVLLLDAGDFMMGTPFHLLGLSGAVELVEMSKLRYDAVALGNHELDWGPAALAMILKSANARGSTLPVVSTNIQFSATDPDDDGLALAAVAGLLPRKVLKDVGGIKVGIFGLLGSDAAGVAPLKKPLTFDDIAVSARAMVKELRQTDKVDVVIALSHSGTDAMGMGEDRQLAEDPMVRAVGGIDVIVSGHTHIVLPKPVVAGSTLIVQTGAFGMNLGKLELTATKTDAGTTVAMTSYELIKLDDSVAGDPAIQADVDGYITRIDEALAPAKLSYKQPVGETSADVVGVPYAESGLGDLVADSYLKVTQALQPMKPPVIAIDAAGDIRDDIKKGKAGVQWLADLFRVQPLGVSPGGQPGFPLVTFYVNGKDIKSAFELSAAAQTISKPDYFLQVAGLSMQIDPKAQVFSRVKSVKIGDVPVDLANTTTCYKVVTNLYVASLVGVVEAATYGMLSVKPKLEDCTTVITDLTTQLVDVDPMTPAIESLKEWQALVLYVSRLPDLNGNLLPDIPASYGVPAGRISIAP